MKAPATRITNLALPALFFAFAHSTSFALTSQQQALKDIQEFANNICTRVPLTSSSTKVELNGQAKAELDGIVKKLANLGISGAANYKSVESINVLQTELASMLKHSDDCRERMANKLIDKLITPATVAPTIEPLLPANVDQRCAPIITKLSGFTRMVEHLDYKVRACVAAEAIGEPIPGNCENDLRQLRATNGEGWDYYQRVKNAVPRIKKAHADLAELYSEGVPCPIPQAGPPPMALCPNPPCLR